MDRTSLLFDAGLALSVLAGLAFAWWRPRASLAQRASHVRNALGPARSTLAPDLDGQRVVLAGVLQASPSANEGAPAVVTALPRGADRLEEPFARAFTSPRFELVLQLESPRQTLPLEGPFQVLLGSAETDGVLLAARARRFFPGATESDLPSSEIGVRSLSLGDPVLVSAVARALPSTGASGDPVRYRLVAPPAEPLSPGVIALAYAGAPRPLTARPIASAAAALAFSLAFAALFLVFYREPSALPAAPVAQADHGGAHLAVARARWIEGDYATTSLELRRARESDPGLAPSLTEISAHVLAGRNRDAAAAARDLASRGEVADPSHRATLECLALSLEAHEGDPSALEHLRVRAGVTHAPMACTILLADDLSGPDRITALGSLHPSLYRDGPSAVAVQILRREAVSTERVDAPSYYPVTVLNTASKMVLTQPIGLIHAVINHMRPTERNDETDLQGFLATFRSTLGQHAEAGKLYTHALAMLTLAEWPTYGPIPPGQAFAYRPSRWDDEREPGYGSTQEERLRDRQVNHRWLMFLGAVLATRAGEIDNARKLLDLAPEEANGRAALSPVLDVLEKGDPEAFRVMMANDAWAPDRPLWEAARAADSITLLEKLKKTGSDGRGVLPWAARHLANDELRAWARDSYPAVCWTCGFHVLVDHTAGRREVAAALGETELTARLEAALALHAEALLRRDVAVPLFVLAGLSPL